MNQNNEEDLKNQNKKSLLFKLKQNAFIKQLLSIKNIKPIIAIILFVVVALVVINIDFSKSKTTTVTSAKSSATDYTSSKAYIDDLESRLTSILSAIKGAGQTRVMITIENGPEINVANQTEEKTTTTGSGSTVTVVTSPILISVAGEDVPLVISETVPKIQGVIVVSTGASDIRVRLDMLYAIQALLDVPKDNIQIFAGS
ncbi:MAG: hypothetical protein IK070_03505 [Clostridia bacterium]|nr:hypothetical protein [Clostridia bacterium]